MNTTVTKLGFYSAAAAFIAAAGYAIVQVLQVLGAVTYPLDAILIYGFSLCIAIPLLLAFLCLHYSVPQDKKIWSHAALLFVAIYVVYVTLNYVVQLATVIPMTLKGALNDVRMLDQTPHSLFWDVDALGYIFMGLACLFALPVFTNHGLQRWIRRFFLANAFITPVVAVVYFYPHFSTALLMLALPWVLTAPGSMLMLALYFRDSMYKAPEHATYPTERSLQA